MSNELLTLKNLKQYFPVGKDRFVRAVDGVDLTINHGDVMGLVGESGSGKSTIAYTVMGMYGMTGGEIDFEGEVFTKETKRKRSMKFRREAQIVFQDPGSSLNPYQDVRSILSLPLKVHKVVPKNEIDDKILEILEMVELPADFMYKSPNSIGGGEKQLVSIARALCCNPKFIILDEPTSSLDVSIQAKIINMLIKLKKEQNLTYMFITHDMGVMRNVSNRVAIMYLGKICEIAPTETFYRNPLHPYTQMLLSSIPVVSEEDETIKPKAVECVGEIPSPVNVPTGCSFHTRCPYKCERCTKEDPVMREVERVVLLRVVDEYWMEHIDAMSDLRQGIRLRAYAQTDPIIAYKKESLEMFEEMIAAIQDETVRRLYSVRLKKNEEVKRERVANATSESVGGDGTVKKQPRKVKKIGRNEPCPCGSGKKYKNCVKIPSRLYPVIAKPVRTLAVAIRTPTHLPPFKESRHVLSHPSK